MTKILSVNAGSSSLKFKLFNMPEEETIAEGVIERIGSILDEDANATIKFNGEKHTDRIEFKDHEVAINYVLKSFSELGIVKDFSEITGIGHRVVAGGEWFNKSVLIDDEVINKIERLISYAPIHQPANLKGIRTFMKVIPDAVQVAVFDTAFHQTMPDVNYLYGLPYEYYTKYGARKYGFHGTSHKYVSERAAKLMGIDLNDSKIITMHLGAGSSIAAVKNGKSIDTTMGFTPIAGLIMATRVGDVDISLVNYIREKEGLTDDQILDVLNNKSGLLGISSISTDMRDLLEVEDTNRHAKLAVDMFVDRVARYAAQYIMELGGVDGIVFTAGIGENSAPIRERVMQKLAYRGLKIDEENNKKRGEEVIISTPDSPFKVMVIPTDEEVSIARDVQALM